MEDGEKDPCAVCEHDERNGGKCSWFEWWEDDGDGECENWKPV